MEKSTQHQSSLESCNLSNGTHYGNVIIDEYAGEIVCDACGVVLEEKILSYQIYKREVTVL